MLARPHRLTDGSEFRRVVRRGRRVARPHTVTYVLPSECRDEARFGIIVGKPVGNAVHRNRVRRRLRATCWELTGEAASHDVVIRALPGSAEASWTTLHDEIVHSVSRGTRR